MHRITVTGHEPGDYLHPDQKLEVIDEATGKKYDLYLRSNAMAPADSGEVSLFVPVTAIREIQTDREYCVLTLSCATTAREAQERRTRLAGASLDPGRPGPPTRTPTMRRKRVVGARAKHLTR